MQEERLKKLPVPARMQVMRLKFQKLMQQTKLRMPKRFSPKAPIIPQMKKPNKQFKVPRGLPPVQLQKLKPIDANTSDRELYWNVEIDDSLIR